VQALTRRCTRTHKANVRVHKGGHAQADVMHFLFGHMHYANQQLGLQIDV